MVSREVPSKIRAILAFSSKVRIGHKKYITLVTTSTGYLHELSDGNIINSLHLGVCRDFSKVKVQTIRDASSGLLHYLLSIEYTIFHVRRASELALESMYEDVESIFIDDRLGCGIPSVTLLHQNGSQSLIEFQQPKVQLKDYMKHILMRIDEQKWTAENKLRVKNEALSQKLRKAADERKLLPREMRCESVAENIPVILYGNVWKKVCNEKLVIGIPIMNITSFRPLSVAGIDVIALCSEIVKLEYRMRFFQCENDFYSLDRLKEHVVAELERNDDELGVDEEDEQRHYGKIPAFSDEWRINEGIQLQRRVLHSQQSGVAVITINLMHFIDSSVYNLNCFITYGVTKANGTTHELQLHAGSVVIRSKELFSDKFWISFKPESAYLDLLAVQAASISIEVTISFKNSPKLKIFQFFTEILKFSRLEEEKNYTSSLNEVFKRIKLEETSLLLYQPEGFMKNMVIKLQWRDEKNVKMEVHAADETKILALFRSIEDEYEEEATVSPRKPRKNWLQMKLYEKITRELKNLVEGGCDWEKQFALEAETDKIFQLAARVCNNLE